MKATYNDLKAAHAKQLNSFDGIFFAFSDDQFAEGMAKLGLKPTEAKGNIFSMGHGGYMLKTKAKAWAEMCKRQSIEMRQLRKDKKEFLKSLVYELKNHEYNVTYDATDALAALELHKDDVPKALLAKACKMAM